jgi:hypothetical protein
VDGKHRYYEVPQSAIRIDVENTSELYKLVEAIKAFVESWK